MQTTEVSLVSSTEFAALALPEATPAIQFDSAQPAAPEIDENTPDIAPVQEESPTVSEPAPDAPSIPAPSPRIAPVPAAPAPPDAEIADAVTPEVVPETGGDTQADAAPATAPEEAATEIVTEAEQPTRAPSNSPRPAARPSRPEPAPAPADTAIADALAEATAEISPERVTPTGPPLSVGEKDALRVSVQNCWNVGSLSSEALSTTVVVTVTMQKSGKPDNASVRMLSFSGGSEAAASQAYEAARRAIIRCGSGGFDLPVDKYSQWQEIEMTFNPEKMRIK